MSRESVKVSLNTCRYASERTEPWAEKGVKEKAHVKNLRRSEGGGARGKEKHSYRVW